MVLSHGLGFRRLADRWQAKISVCKLREFSGLLETIAPLRFSARVEGFFELTGRLLED